MLLFNQLIGDLDVVYPGVFRKGCIGERVVSTQHDTIGVKPLRSKVLTQGLHRAGALIESVNDYEDAAAFGSGGVYKL